MVIWKGWFETAPCRATLATPFPALCPRILGTRFTNCGLRMFWGELMLIWKRWFETVPCRAPLNTPFSALCPRILRTRFTNYGLRVSGTPFWGCTLTGGIIINGGVACVCARLTISGSTPTPWSGPFRDHGLNPPPSNRKPLEIKGFLGLERPFLDLVSQTPRPRGRGRPLFAERWCFFCAFCAFLRVSVRFFFLPKWPPEKRNFAHKRAKMCTKRFCAIPPLVIPPFCVSPNFGHLKRLIRDVPRSSHLDLHVVNTSHVTPEDLSVQLTWVGVALWGGLENPILRTERHHLENTAPARDGLACGFKITDSILSAETVLLERRMLALILQAAFSPQFQAVHKFPSSNRPAAQKYTLILFPRQPQKCELLGPTSQREQRLLPTTDKPTLLTIWFGSMLNCAESHRLARSLAQVGMLMCSYRKKIERKPHEGEKGKKKKKLGFQDHVTKNADVSHT